MSKVQWRIVREAAWLAVVRAWPVALGVASYGVVFGILAGQAGLSGAQSLLMSAAVFAGASQFVALELWGMPLPVFTIVVTTLVVNLRHVLMGAALAPRLEGLPRGGRWLAVFFVADENWALTMAALAERPRAGAEFAAGYLVGGGLLFYAAWLASTVLGQSCGGLMRDPAAWGLDFAFTAAFIALLVLFWRGKGDLLPWLVAAGVALLAARFIPGKWYILLGGLAGSLAGALLPGDGGGENDSQPAAGGEASS